jgi:G3E family GTPase
MDSVQKPIKVYVITGFLGAGKTTMLNRLLAAKKEERNVVIENEFGKVSIDSMLVSEKFDSIFELNNGCICCSLDEELSAVLSDLTRQNPRPDNLFIEASGVADPGGVASIFTQKEVQEYFKLQQVICLADAATIEDLLEDIPEAGRQLAAADLIIINKESLVSPSYRLNLSSLIQSQNALAEIRFTDFGNIELDFFERERNVWIQKEVGAETNRSHSPPYKSFLLEFDQRFDYDLLLNQLTVLLFLSYHQVYRIKGMVWFEREKSPFLIQTHGRQVDITLFDGNIGTEFHKSQIVVIGKDIQRSSLEKVFKRALFKSVTTTKSGTGTVK